ncbi:hypothetical protein R1sor_012034 [Riccia sorocarpa]|uniref:Reverse transcriptase domain-containing protein n=1 Tax=Riccia sorocarpa TaxID=122646 RepID=A0ABD3I304_9MARC
MDNVITLKICQDLTNSTGQPVIFCELDFEKAFDWVQHEYLWETLAAMKFDQKFINLVHMLVAGGKANVQVDGKLTETLNLQRGVRQGCPVSPLLFALCTQPLTCMLRESQRQGQLKGVIIPKGRPLLHKLFADDSGICISATEENFQALKTVIGRFEAISGAKLNISTNKTSLIGWDRMTKRKEMEGLELKPFKEVSDTLKMKYVSRLMSGERTEWAEMSRYLIHKEMTARAKGAEYRWWTVEEGLLLLPSVPSPKNTTVRHMINAWKKFRKFLFLQEEEWNFPSSLTLSQFCTLIRLYSRSSSINDRVLLPIMKKLGFSVLVHLQDCSGAWKNFRRELRHREIRLTEVQEREITNLHVLLRKTRTEVSMLQHSDSWRWESSEQSWKGWNRSTQFWAKLLPRKEEAEDLTPKWNMQEAQITWKQRWKAVWGSSGSYQSKIWIWRVLKNGFFTSERAERIGVSDEPCHRCDEESETTDHLFWGCRKVVPGWLQLRIRATESNVNFRIPATLIGTIDEAVTGRRKGHALLHIVSSYLQKIWRDRNQKVHENKDEQTPLAEILKMARYEVEGLLQGSGTETHRSAVEDEWQEVTKLLGSITEQSARHPRRTDHHSQPQFVPETLRAVGEGALTERVDRNQEAWSLARLTLDPPSEVIGSN